MQLVNAGLYSLVWLLCVWGGAHQQTTLPVLAVLLSIALQLTYQAYLNKESYYQDLILVCYATLTGALMETLFIATGLLQYTTPSAFFWWFPPAWIIGLYPLFALTFNHSLKPFTSRWPLLICVGAVGGPLSYWAGKKLGALTFEASPATTFSLLAIAWAVYLSLFKLFADQLRTIVTRVLDTKNNRTRVTMLYDGECPLCKREVAHLQKRNANACVKFVDIATPDYRQHPLQDISYEKAMKEMLVVREGGEVLCGVEAFQEVYAKVRYPLLSILLQLPLLKYAFRFLYKVFARHRLTFTGRGPD